FRFIMVNRSLAQMDGILVELHLGKTLREVLGKVAETIERQLERVLATGQPVLNFEVQAVLPARTDESHWLEHYFPIKDTNGLVQRIGMLVVDTTEQKKMEQSLRSLAKSLQQERLQM